MTVEIVTIPCLSDNYAYLVRDEGSGQVAVVDAPEAAPILKALDDKGWRADQIWITHHHGDHIDGVGALVDKYGSKVVGHTKDRARLPALGEEVSEGDTVTLGETHARIIDVSGHTIGHIAFILDADNAAFTADSLMALGCGRVFEGTHHMMWESLSKFLGLPDEMMIYSGHNYGQANGRFAISIEPENTDLQARIERIKQVDADGTFIVPVSMAEEKATNPFLRAGGDSRGAQDEILLHGSG